MAEPHKINLPRYVLERANNGLSYEQAGIEPDWNVNSKLKMRSSYANHLQVVFEDEIVAFVNQRGEIAFTKTVPEDAYRGITQMIYQYFKTSERVTKIKNAEKRHVNEKAKPFFITQQEAANQQEFGHNALSVSKGLLGLCHKDPEFQVNGANYYLLGTLNGVDHSFSLMVSSQSFKDINKKLCNFRNGVLELVNGRNTMVNVQALSNVIEDGLQHYEFLVSSQEFWDAVRGIIQNAPPSSEADYKEATAWYAKHAHLMPEKTHKHTKISDENFVFKQDMSSFDFSVMGLPVIHHSVYASYDEDDPEDDEPYHDITLPDDLRKNVKAAFQALFVQRTKELMASFEMVDKGKEILKEAKREESDYEMGF